MATTAASLLTTITTIASAVAKDPSKFQATLTTIETAQKDVLVFIQTLKSGDTAAITSAIQSRWPDVAELLADKAAMDAENAKGPGITSDEVLADIEKGMQFVGSVAGLVLKFGPLFL